MMFRHVFGLHRGPGVFAWLLLVLLIAALALGAVALVRLWKRTPNRAQAGPSAPLAPPMDPAFTELRIRYARGDLTWEEYVQRATNLGYPIQPGSGSHTDPFQPPPPRSTA
ncbi:MAG TPA: hypothetical protein VK217_13565 [Acidimicrobiales bacterium]|nr:hypothetical protein [Acidimicrobiales bacterium]